MSTVLAYKICLSQTVQTKILMWSIGQATFLIFIVHIYIIWQNLDYLPLLHYLSNKLVHCSPISYAVHSKILNNFALCTKPRESSLCECPLKYVLLCFLAICLYVLMHDVENMLTLFQCLCLQHLKLYWLIKYDLWQETAMCRFVDIDIISKFDSTCVSSY